MAKSLTQDQAQILVQNVCKGYQLTTLANKEFKNNSFHSLP